MRSAGSWSSALAALCALACAAPQVGPVAQGPAGASAAEPPRREDPAAAVPTSPPPPSADGAAAAATSSDSGASASGAERAAGAQSAPPSSGRDAFPRPDALAALARRPTAERVFTEAAEEVDGWILLDPPAGAPPIGEHAPQGFWDQRLAAFAARRAGAVRLTEPMSCLARQVGRFTLVRKLRPGPATLAFMSSRCGVAEAIGMAMVSVELHGGEADEELQPVLEKPFQEHLQELLSRGRLTAGVWYGRAQDRALVLLVTAEPLARLEAFPYRPGSDGRVVVRGELLRPAARVSGLVTRGRYGFASCDVDPGVALPRFAVSCPVDAADDAATLELAAFGPRRIFGPVVVAAQLWPRGDPPPVFARPELTAALRGPVDGDLRATLARLIDGVRREAGLPPLELAPEQSDTAGALAPHFFAAAAKHDDGAMETIVLGLRAGWQVPGTVRAGLFTYSRSDDLRDAGRLLSVALARPSGREALLHPEVRALAIGTLREERGVGAVFSTYALVDPARAAAETRAFVDRLDAERERRGLGRTEPYPALEARVAEVAAALERGDTDPHRAVKTVMPREAKPDPALGAGKRYSWIGAGERIETVKLPAELVEARALRVAVAVGHCRLEGSPWAEACVVVGALEPRAPGARRDAR